MTAEEITILVNELEPRVVARLEIKIKATIQKLFEDLEIPDTKGFIKKQVFEAAIEALKTGMNEEFKKTNEAVTKIATETETKIAALTPPKSKPWYATVIDWEND